jgi:hypothetical protein
MHVGKTVPDYTAAYPTSLFTVSSVRDPNLTQPMMMMMMRRFNIAGPLNDGDWISC